jgi:sulfide:quinone oxidoreductase
MSLHLNRGSASRRRVVVVGGGVAALEALIGLRSLAGDRVELELIAPEQTFVYRPLAVAAAFGGSGGPNLELADVARIVDATCTADSVTEVDPAAGVATLASGERAIFDVIVIAVGARPVESIPGAIVFGVPRGTQRLRAVIAEAEQGRVSRIAFAVPEGLRWPLPLYELALLTADRLRDAEVELILLSPEPAPLAVFGGRASGAVLEELEDRGIQFRPGLCPREVAWGQLRADPGNVRLAVDAAVTLPQLRGPAIAGLAADEEGFLPVDSHCLVRGTTNVYAAGDVIAFPVKHGGLASQQADAAAEAIAAGVGVHLQPAPFAPVLRGMLLTGRGPRFLEAAADGEGLPGTASSRPLWWPPAKTPGRFLAPYLAGQITAPPALVGGLPVELKLEARGAERRDAEHRVAG